MRTSRTIGRRRRALAQIDARDELFPLSPNENGRQSGEFEKIKVKSRGREHLRKVSRTKICLKFSPSSPRAIVEILAKNPIMKIYMKMNINFIKHNLSHYISIYAIDTLYLFAYKLITNTSATVSLNTKV